jgi:adenine-specific DNA-methyltransferase
VSYRERHADRPNLRSSKVSADAVWEPRELVTAALQLGAANVPGWSKQETALARQFGGSGIRGGCDGRGVDRFRKRSGSRATASDTIRGSARGDFQADDGAEIRERLLRTTLKQLREQIRAGDDPLGHAFIEMRAADIRRRVGATYTPGAIVNSMLAWAGEQGTPQRVVDPGVGSGRFLLRAAKVFSTARLVGIEIDPLAALITRANLAAAGLARRSVVELKDYREIDLRSPQRTLYVGNPPYVRHHHIDARWKDWFARQWRGRGFVASRLAGLHIHFFLATLLNANTADWGAFITAAEWLDVNYGSSLRNSFVGSLGGEGLIVVEPTALPFPDAATTAAITLFKVGSNTPSVRLRRVKGVKQLDNLSGGRQISRTRLASEARWSRLTYPARQRPHGFVELGELCRVHRGQATGANEVWIAGTDSAHALPSSVLFATVTKARELIVAGKVLRNIGHLRNVVDLPEDLEQFDRAGKTAIDRFLREAKRQGAHKSYLACHRRVWWSVGLRAAAPILATYMARRAPVFTRNPSGARHLNIAHGLYPREHLTEEQLLALVDHLSSGVSVTDGRTYAGGLTKFEPREMERLLVPLPAA